MLTPVRLALVLLAVQAVHTQIMEVSGEEEHNMVYQMLVPHKENRVDSSQQTLYYIHSDGFDNCTLAFDFFANPTNSADASAESVTARLTVADSKGKELLSRGDKDSDETGTKAKDWTVGASKAGVYSLTVENLSSVDQSPILLVNFRGCKKFQKLVKQDDMAEVNRRADNAIGTLFHNLVELEHSEGRLTHRKESRLR
jgi:hypothetical protein